MKLQKYEWVRFRKSPLRQVIGQVRFTIIPRFGQDTFIASFQEAIRSSYPKVAREAAITYQLSPTGIQPNTGEKLWRFSSRDLLWSVVVGESAITLESRAYYSMKDFLKRFRFLLEVAKEQLEVADRLRLGLRYINEVRYPGAESLADWRNLLNTEFVSFDAFELLDGQVDHTIQEIQVNRSDGVLAIRHGLLNGTKVAPLEQEQLATGPFYLIDLDYYDVAEYNLDIPATIQQMQAYNDIMYRFSAGHLVIDSTITWSQYMRNVSNISNPLRIVSLRESQGEYTGGIVSLPLPAVSFVTGTSEDTCSPDEAEHVSIRDMFPYQLLAKATGAELPECSRLLQIVVYEVASDIVLTSYQTVRVLPNETPQMRLIQHSEQEVPAVEYSRLMQARRLREISGLTVEQLADIFGVSRTTYHKWMEDSSLSERHKEHLLEVLPLVEETLRRLGSASAVNAWLLTPVTAGGKKPIEYLSSRQYNTFRGFLLHQGRDQNLPRPPIPLGYPYLERSREEVEDELERLNPGFIFDEDYSDATDRNE